MTLQLVKDIDTTAEVYLVPVAITPKHVQKWVANPFDPCTERYYVDVYVPLPLGVYDKQKSIDSIFATSVRYYVLFPFRCRLVWMNLNSSLSCLHRASALTLWVGSRANLNFDTSVGAGIDANTLCE